MRKSYHERWGHDRHPCKGIARQKRVRKREEAETRNVKCYAMGIVQRLDIIAQRSGNSVKELARIKAKRDK